MELSNIDKQYISVFGDACFWIIWILEQLILWNKTNLYLKLNTSGRIYLIFNKWALILKLTEKFHEICFV